jgi:peptidoglycan hydrolase-like protein with peptidoglycan-binding domain
MHIKTKIAGALMLAVLIMPGVSFAQTMTTAQLQAEIASLTAQLTQLKAQLAAQTGGSTSWCYTFNTNLSIGMSGSAVTALQTALQKDGESVTVSGTFDDQTAAAVTGFQEKYASNVLSSSGLSNGTGYAGKATRTKLNALFECGTTQTQSVSTSTPNTSNPSVSLTVNGQNGVVSAVSGSQITLAWSSAGATSCTASSPSWTGSQNLSGTAVTTLPTTALNEGVQYTLACTTSSGGTVQSTVQVNINPSTTVSGNTSNNGFTISPSVTTGFTQGSNNAISWSGGACAAGMPNSCVTLLLENAQGSCHAPSASTPCNVGFVPAPVNSPSSGSYSWDAKTQCGSGSGNGPDQWTDCQAVTPGLYRIIAQDANGNTVSSGDILISDAATAVAIANPPTVTLASPNGGDVWNIGSTNEIMWSARNTNSTFSVALVTYSGSNITTVAQIASNVPNTMWYYDWTIPASIAPGQYEIQVTSGNAGAISHSPFTIGAQVSSGLISFGSLLAQNAITGNPYTISWTAPSSLQSVNIILLRNGQAVQTIGSNIPNTGLYIWNIPSAITQGSGYQFEITASGYASVTSEQFGINGAG